MLDHDIKITLKSQFWCEKKVLSLYNLRIEMQVFSLNWMMQNIRLINVCEALGLLGDIKNLLFCLIQCKLKI